MNISMRQKQTQTYRTDLWLPRETGRGARTQLPPGLR